ncbi:DNA mismatch repair protein [Coemansia sp. RSA 2336]|nr:DNA mismatch repair protein [Coemansia sp. RSA 2336]
MSAIGIVEVKSRHKGTAFRCLVRNEQQVFCERCDASSLDVFTTAVRISSLFAQFPVRQALLNETAKKITEKIKQLLQIRLLAYPDIALQFIAGSTGTQSFTYAKVQSLNQRVAQVYGPMVAQSLDTVSLDYGSYSLNGSISREPVQGRIQHIFIDSRPCTALDLVSIVRSTLMTESYSALGRSESAAQLTKVPAFVLNISCKSSTSYTSDVDYLEIRRLLVLTCVKFLRKYGLISDTQMQAALSAAESPSGAKRVLNWDNAMGSERKRRSNDYAITNSSSSRSNACPFAGNSEISSIEQKFTCITDVSGLQVIGQADDKYILCQQDGWLVAIDQHAADERIRLEKLFDDYTETLHRVSEAASTTNSIAEVEGISILVPPVEVRLSSHAWSKISSVNAELKQLGIQLAAQTLPVVDEPGMCLAHIVAAPTGFALRLSSSDSFASELLYEASEWAANNALLMSTQRQLASQCMQETASDVSRWWPVLANAPQIMVETLKSIACRGALKFNEHLSKHQCQQLVDQLQQCKFPGYCAHGR